MLSKSTYTKLYRLSAWYDLVLSWPFALAATLTVMWGSVLTPLNASLGFPPVTELDVHAVLFANFFGSVVIIWALVRLYLNDPRLGLFDGVARLLFSVAMINALLSGISPLVWGLLVPEFLFGVMQLALYPNAVKRHSAA